MPVISRFYGVVIKMYYKQGEHNPPHIHAIYGEYAAAIDITNLNVLDGSLPRKELAMVLKWVEMHQLELLLIWVTQKFDTIEPLS